MIICGEQEAFIALKLGLSLLVSLCLYTKCEPHICISVSPICPNNLLAYNLLKRTGDRVARVHRKWVFLFFATWATKRDGPWWRVLTKCGPLEKGMANHFIILALRTPWTVWKGKNTIHWKTCPIPGQYVSYPRCPICYWRSVQK